MAHGSTRGKRMGDVARRARGTCPSCGTTAIKLLYPHTVNGSTVKVCKRCRNKKAT